MRGDLQGGRRQMAGDGGARSVRGSARLQIESRECGEERTLNMCCTFVTLEVSKLSGWLNADAYCREPKGGHAVRPEVRASRQGRRRPACRGGLDCRLGTRHGEERTKNIWYMVVTLEVSQLETSALKFFKLTKRLLMSVMAETSQSAMGPYVAMAAVGLAL